MFPVMLNYHQFRKIFVLKTIVRSPTRVTCKSASIIDRISASFPSSIFQHVSRKINTIIIRGIHKLLVLKNHGINIYLRVSEPRMGIIQTYLEQWGK